jgi:branched-chain amino acid transport system ATP-binding protein
MDPTANPSPAALRTAGLGFRVGGSEILTDINLEVEGGAFLGIIGPNGAGKSTLLNLLSGTITPTAGTIEFEGQDMRGVGPSARARLGLGRTFQTSSLFNSLTVLENARLAVQARHGGSMRVWRRPRADDAATTTAFDALQAVGLADMAMRITAALSHGEKRKLELAVLLAGEARVLLLDEPMAGVNTGDVPMLVDLIGRLHSEGRTVVMVEHHMAVVLGLAEKVAVLDFGRLLALGDPASVMADEAVQSAYLGEPL